MGRALRFCMITTFYPPYNFGGDGIFVHRLANALADRGHQVDVIHSIDAYRLLARDEPDGSYENHPNVTVHGLRSRFGVFAALACHQASFPVLQSAQFRRILMKDFDVIHYHNISLAGGAGILGFGRAIKLYTMHEFWLVCATHGLFRFNRAPCTTRHCLLCTLTYRRPPQWWRSFGLLRAAVKHVDLFIAPSRFSRTKHQELGFDAPIAHLPHFVPWTVDVSSPNHQLESDDLAQKPYFLFAGRLEKLKGLETIIPLFRNFPKARLLVAGTGTYEPRLRRLAGGNANIRFVGMVPGERLKRFYKNAVALICPSINFEISPPLVILEAFSQKTPAIVRNLGSMPEAIEESGAGFVYDTNEELLNAMNRLLADPPYRRELGLRGIEACRRNWSLEVHMERYFALIRQAAARGHVSDL